MSTHPALEAFIIEMLDQGVVEMAGPSTIRKPGAERTLRWEGFEAPEEFFVELETNKELRHGFKLMLLSIMENPELMGRQVSGPPPDGEIEHLELGYIERIDEDDDWPT